MAFPYRVMAGKSARDNLAALHLKYRGQGLGSVIAHADHKITKALSQNPQGGSPVAGTLLLTVKVRPLLATYEIVGQEVRILRYDDSP